MTDNISELLPVDLDQEVKDSYLSYAMSVIISRALPDVRDGLKPVHRRILYVLDDLACHSNKTHRKCARIIGEVIGKYHPHGESAVYEALVRMAQDFSLGAPLVDGQGNFGSIDGDPPAAMRYTEARLTKIAHEILRDLDKETVDFRPNYDGLETEPLVLPAAFPNILVNGSSGVAVGMATNIPPHNLGEVIDACIAYIEDNSISIEKLLEIIPGPDFPTGGTIVGAEQAKLGLLKGRGIITIQGKTHTEKVGEGSEAIIVDELPYQTNKAKMIERIAELVKEKRIDGIQDLRDESDRDGIRVVIELRKNASTDIMLNQILQLTQLRTSFGVNMVALKGGVPRSMSLLEIISTFVDFRLEIVSRRINFQLRKARDRAHLLIGLSVAVSNIEKVIAIIRASRNTKEARETLLREKWPASGIEEIMRLVADNANFIEGGLFYFTETQVNAILEMKLHRLTALEKEKVNQEIKEIAQEISRYLKLLSSKPELLNIIRKELTEIRKEFATARRTTIEAEGPNTDIKELIKKEDVVISYTARGYIKRAPLEEYRAQNRGGKGKISQKIKDEDNIANILIANTHSAVLVFSDLGRVYREEAYKIPTGSAQSRGRALVNIFPIAEDEKVTNIISYPDEITQNQYSDFIFVTSKGNIRRTALEAFRNINSNGKIAIKLAEQEKLVSVSMCNPEDHVFITTKMGKCIRFPVDSLRVVKSRSSNGVRAIKLKENDEVISASILEYTTQNSKQDSKSKEKMIITITSNGFGKCSSISKYRVTQRGGVGITNIKLNERNGAVVSSFPIAASDQIMLITNAGKTIRTKVQDVRVTSRVTSGVILIRASTDEAIVSVVRIANPEQVGG
ncbi:DNA gyrase subunit A [Rickettsiales bacterium]|nr:DNA gyrase subunit A [Rickettsiales bacterium]